ncbi:MAG: 4-hydroxy-3-methylbut-2-enyl diphosphate reductase [Chloroflexota bacterium]|nr:4-hydroxy-3-methylbut-2-enyl diphosphate reductase [Chloroflexota bacterium]
MQIEKAQELGLCFGVRRAIKMLKEASARYGKIETLGPVAHNRQLVEGLARAGITPVDKLEQANGKILAISAHGVSPSVLHEIEARHINIIDTTCPIVRRAQNTARELAESGFDVIVFGEAEHSEVKGLLGWAGGKGMATLDAKQLIISPPPAQGGELPSDTAGENHPPGERLGIIAQTTQSGLAFTRFVAELITTRVPESKEIRIVNTLCQATQERQEAAVELAQKCQLMIVVGGHNSANTRRLAEVCLPVVETHLVENASELDKSWLTGKQHMGITAGASTSDEAVEEVISWLKSP